MGLPLALEISDTLVRFADEGVPLCAIARATKISSDIVREQLHAARSAGRLIDLPRDDWPPGFPRDERARQRSRLVTENREQLYIAMQQMFGLTPTEIELLLVMIQHKLLPKERVNDDMTAGTVYVHVCRIRQRLEPYDIRIQTVWGHGYRFLPVDRRKVMNLILKKVAP